MAFRRLGLDSLIEAIQVVEGRGKKVCGCYFLARFSCVFLVDQHNYIWLGRLFWYSRNVNNAIIRDRLPKWHSWKWRWKVYTMVNCGVERTKSRGAWTLQPNLGAVRTMVRVHSGEVISYKWEPLREGFDENRKCRSTNAVSGISLHVSIRVHILNFFLPVMFYSSIFGYFIESAIGAYPAEELQCLAEPEHAKATILTWGIEQ